MNIFNKQFENKIVLLRPLEPNDFYSFLEIAFDESIWYRTTHRIQSEADLRKYVDVSIKEREKEFRYPFTIIDKRVNRIAGCTSYANVSEKDMRLEIGWTWLGKEFQGTGLNKACKFLLLQNAFEKLGFERVEFKTDVLNMQSRKALRKLGAQEEGILRSHTLMYDGRRRDTIYYSILKSEWEEIRVKIFPEYLNE